MKLPVILTFLLFISTYLYSANNQTSDIDSLKSELEKAESDSLILQLEEDIWFLYFQEQMYSEALIYAESCLDYYLENDSIIEAIRTYSNIGGIYYFIKDYETSIDYYIKGFELAEQDKRSEDILMLSNNIAYLLLDVHKYSEAIGYLNKCIDNFQTVDSLWMEEIYLDMGKAFLKLNNTDSAKVSVLKSIDLSSKLNDTLYITKGLNLLGEIKIENYKLQPSDTLYNQAINHFKLSIKNNDNTYKDEMSNSYLGMGRLALLINDHKLAVLHLNKAINLFDNYEINKYLSKAYHNIGNNSKAYFYINEYHRLNDSIQESIKAELLNDKLSQYEFDKQVQEIRFKQKEKDLIYEKEQQQDKLLKRFMMLVLLIITIFSIQVLRSFLRKKKDNALLVEQKEEITSQRDEIEAQRDSIFEQKNEIEKVHEEVEASINYAERIQRSILPDEALLKNDLSDHFIFFKPRDIVSGDFYWFKKVRNYLVITAADCTGHGVPGAFMSMLGVSFLNEIVSKSKFDSSDLILNRLRDKIKNALKQKGEIGENKDGMDMALCVINLETKELQFSGAYNPLYIIRNGEMIQIKADRQPIAVYLAEKPFTLNTHQLEDGDCLYMFSDGFPDQFGGEKERKFMTKRFKQMLVDNHLLPFEEQKNILDKTFTDWKNGYDQMDDVIVIGLKV